MSRASDILLILLFVAAINLPLLGWVFHWQGAGLRENRNLAPAPDFRGGRVPELPGKIDAYYSDHVGFRGVMVWISGIVTHQLLQTSRDAVILGKVPAPGEPRWMFYAGNGLMQDRLGQEPLTREQLEMWRTRLERRNEWLAARGIRYLFVIVPEKSTVYPELLPDYLQKSVRATKLDQLTEYLRNNRSPVSVLDLRDSLKRAKTQGYLYFSGDTHWNGPGFFAANREIFQALSALSPELKQQEFGKSYAIQTSFGDKYNDLASLLGLRPERRSFPVVAQLHPARVSVAQSEWPGGVEPPGSEPGRFALANSGGQNRLLIFHDSFLVAGPRSETDQPLAAHFGRTYFAWTYPTDHALESFVNLEHPGIVLEERVERTLGDIPASAPAQPLTTHLAPAKGAPAFYMDVIGGRTAKIEATVRSGAWITVSGWAMDRAAGAPAAGVDITIDGVPIAAAYGYQRPDLVAQLQCPPCLNSGFRAEISPSVLSVGEHSLGIRVVSSDGRSYAEAPYGRIFVTR